MSAFALHTMFAMGGGLGAMMRHALTRAVDHRFPVATLIVNVFGSLLLGALLAHVQQEPGVAGAAWSRALIGFCGGFTTFSSFAVQSIALLRRYSLAHLLANVVLNLAACLGAYWLGARLVIG